MRAIAEKAGVSTTTVSLALRDHDSISTETKSRIIKLQHALGYEFNNSQTRSHRGYRPPLEQITYRMIGIDMREDNYAPFLTGISAECRSRSIRLEFENVPSSDQAQPRQVNSGTGTKRGTILSGWLKPEDIDQAEQSGLPFVVLGNYFFNRPIHMVGVNLFDVAERAMQDLVADGMTSVVFFVEEHDRPYEREIIRCLRGVLFDLGIPMERTAIVQGDANFKNMARAKAELMEHIKSGSQIFTLEIHCAEAVARALQQAPGQAGPQPKIATFVSSKPRLPSPGYRAFDMDLELCGRLAVTRLTELQRSLGLPPNSSYIYSPGWVA